MGMGRPKSLILSPNQFIEMRALFLIIFDRLID
jgi:hypothetical protein